MSWLRLTTEVELMFSRLIVPTIDRRHGEPFVPLAKKTRLGRGKDPETKKKNDAAWRQRHHYREIIRRRAYRERGKVPGMTQIEVYDALVPLVGEPAVFKYPDGDHVVGRWTTSATAEGSVDPSKVGAWDLLVLRGKDKTVLVLGRGASWDEAYERAKVILGSSDPRNGGSK